VRIRVVGSVTPPTVLQFAYYVKRIFRLAILRKVEQAGKRSADITGIIWCLIVVAYQTIPSVNRTAAEYGAGTIAISETGGRGE
jgi:hypothetical protein